MRDSNTNHLLTQQDPDIVSCNSRNNQASINTNNGQRAGISETGGFEVEGMVTLVVEFSNAEKA